MVTHLIVSYISKKFVTENRSKKSSANNSDSRILTPLNVNILNPPPIVLQRKLQKKKPKASDGKNDRIVQKSRIFFRLRNKRQMPVYAELQQQH